MTQNLVFQLKDLVLLLYDHKLYARRRTVKVRRVLNNVYKLAHLKTYLDRRRLLHTIGAVENSFTIPEDKGFIIWRPSSFPPLQEAIAEAKSTFATADLDALAKAMPQDASFTHVPFELHTESPIARLSTHSAFIKPLAEYLGGIPVLLTLQLMYSPNHRMVPGSAQYYHLDAQDVRTLQVFVFIDNVTDENGPVTVLTASASGRVANALKYRKTPATRRIDDEVISNLVEVSKDIHVLTGKAGSVCIFDSDRCFHFGSRKGTKPRRILHYAYVSPFAFTLPTRWWEASRYRHLVRDGAPAWQRSVVGRT